MSSTKRYVPPRIDSRGSVIAATTGTGINPAELMPPNPTPLVEDGVASGL